MNKESNNGNKEKWIQYAPIIGIVLVVSGFLLLLDQRIQTHWLSLAIPVLISIILIISGILTRKRLWLIPGFILFGISSAIFILFQQLFIAETVILISWALGLISVSWLLLFTSLALLRKIWTWWSLIVAMVAGALSYNFSLSDQSLLSYIFSISVGIGFCFLLWGGIKISQGLIIPGLLISTIGSGVYFAWTDASNPNGLKETGIMLVWFSLGWILITVSSRVFSKKFVWWPLIPGGVLAMVGSGLYIGGNPENALGFFQNTGSIGLILFGVYLILLKFGMNK